MYETWRIGVLVYVELFNRAILFRYLCYGRRATLQVVRFSSYFSLDDFSPGKLSVNT